MMLDWPGLEKWMMSLNMTRNRNRMVMEGTATLHFELRRHRHRRATQLPHPLLLSSPIRSPRWRMRTRRLALGKGRRPSSRLISTRTSIRALLRRGISGSLPVSPPRLAVPHLRARGPVRNTAPTRAGRILPIHIHAILPTPTTTTHSDYSRKNLNKPPSLRTSHTTFLSPGSPYSATNNNSPPRARVIPSRATSARRPHSRLPHPHFPPIAILPSTPRASHPLRL